MNLFYFTKKCEKLYTLQGVEMSPFHNPYNTTYRSKTITVNSFIHIGLIVFKLFTCLLFNISIFRINRLLLAFIVIIVSILMDHCMSSWFLCVNLYRCIVCMYACILHPYLFQNMLDNFIHQMYMRKKMCTGGFTVHVLTQTYC